MTSRTPPVSDRTPDGTAYDVAGPRDAPCVILIHGLGLSRALWDQHMDAFAAMRTIRYDLLGHGDSAPVKGTCSLADYCVQIVELMDHLGVSRAHLVGFSIGGMINRRFALDYPDKLASLVILNSPHDRGAEAQEQVEARARSVREQGAFSTFDAALERWFTAAYLTTGSGPTAVRTWREQVDAESYAQTAWVLANGVRELIAPDPAIKAHCLVMTCENDSGSTPEMARDIAAEIEGSELRIVPHLQHLGLMEQPQLFTRPIVDFLNRIET